MHSAAANVYLVMAAVIAAGLDGIAKEMELPPQNAQPEDGVHASKLPISLEESLQALEGDEYMVSKMGADFIRWYAQVKRAEIQAIEAKVEQFSKGSEIGSESYDAAVSAAWQHMYMEFI